MNETVETGASLWPAIVLAVYWAYLLVWTERDKQNDRSTLFSSGLPPPGAATAKVLPAAAPPAAAAQAAFDQDSFLIGARKAYEFILKSYAAGSIGDLTELLDPSVLEVFSTEVERREADGEQIALSFVALKDTEIVETEFDASASVVRVRFESEIFVSERKSDPNASIPESTRLLHAVDLWTFRKEYKSESPVWTLIATDAA